MLLDAENVAEARLNVLLKVIQRHTQAEVRITYYLLEHIDVNAHNLSQTATYDIQSEGINYSESMSSDVEMIDEAEKEQSEAGATSDWEMDRESFGSEQGSELDLMEEELMHLVLKTSPSNPSVPKPIQHPPVDPPLPNKPGMMLASASSDLAAESTPKLIVTLAIRRGLTEGAKAGFFQYISQGTRE